MTMSAESPHKTSCRCGHVVTPQPVSDRSIIESVAGFINEVVPQAYTSLPPGEAKEAITWARFEYGDINDPALYPDSVDDRSSTAPLLLVLGYGNGVQVWAIPASGEATEVLSWRQGVVRTLRVLPTPLADSPVPDAFGHKRPLVALCDSAGPGPQFCSISFISLRCGDQVKSIKFKNPVSDILANRRSVVVTFPERIAIFDACTLEDRLTVTTCYPCPGPNPNPVTLGSRWLAYAERQLLPSKRSSGGSEGEGVQSYTATVLHAAKSLGKGLRELGETVASSLTGSAGATGVQRNPMGAIGSSAAVTAASSNSSDIGVPGVVTVLDAQGIPGIRADDSRSGETAPMSTSADLMLAHFAAHNEPIVALQFDPSGMLLLTADKRGHDFHLFRIQPHPNGSSLAAVHHLYVLHRGDTTAKVQDITFAADSRWVAVSTLRGTTHVFPITPYGGPVGIRTHTTPHVVNRLSRFHRSAGLTADGRNSPIPSVSSTNSVTSYDATMLPLAMPYPNPRLPPYPHPTVVSPLAQIRQPISHILSGMAPMSPTVFSQQNYHRNPSTRMIGRSQSVSDEGSSCCGLPLRVAASFAAPRAWLVSSPTVSRESSNKIHKRSIDSLFVMACHGSLIQYDLEAKHVTGIPKEKVCDDTAIELEVKAKAQWVLLRPTHSSDVQPPLPASNPLMVLPDHLPPASESRPEDVDERWLSQVEIVTHAGPHRRLWMGPQFTFKTYTNTTQGAPLSLLEMEAVEIGTGIGSRPARSNPVNMPLSGRPVVPVLIESGSASSYEQSPRLLEAYGAEGDSDGSVGPGDTQLREDLADAMMESPGAPMRDTGRRSFISMHSKKSAFPIEKVVNPVGTVITVAVPSDEEVGGPSSPSSALAGCERMLPAGIGQVDIDVVRWPSAVSRAESTVNVFIEENSNHKQKEEKLKHCSTETAAYFHNMSQNIDIVSSSPVEDKVYFGTKSNENVNKIVKSEYIDSRKLDRNFMQKQVSKIIESDFFVNEDSDVSFSGKCNSKLSVTGCENMPQMQLNRKLSENYQKTSCVVDEDKSNDFEEMRNKKIIKPCDQPELEKCDSKNHNKHNDNIDFMKSGIPKKYKRSIGKKKRFEDISRESDTCALSLSCSVTSEMNVTRDEDNGTRKLEKTKKEKTELVIETACNTITKTAILTCSGLNEENFHANEVDFSLHNANQNDEHQTPVKFERNVLQGINSSSCEDPSNDLLQSLENRTIANSSIAMKTVCRDEQPTTSFGKSRKQKVSCNVIDTDTVNKQVDFVVSSSSSKYHKDKRGHESYSKQCVLDVKTIDYDSSAAGSSKAKGNISSAVDYVPTRSWSSVLTSCKANTLQSTSVSEQLETEASVEISSSNSHSIAKKTFSEEDSTLDSSLLREDSKNNNQQEDNYLPINEEILPLIPPPSWSSIVTSSKTGASSSTDEGSGDYDSNESKDSADLPSNELEDKGLSETRKVVKNSELLSCVGSAVEEGESDTVKIVNEEESSDPVENAATVSKKNRRTKKKRR